jgi:signal transduction histidine kinase
MTSDALLAGLLVVLAFTGQGDPAPGQPTGATTTPSYVVVLVSCALLVLRRRWPVAIWAAVLGTALVGVWVQGSLTQAVLSVLVALYTVAAYRAWPIAMASAAVTAIALAAAEWVADDLLFSDSMYALLAIGGMATAIGIAVRSRRAVLAAAQERALAAEQSREEEAERRVTEERLRIARELHDVVAHHMAVISVQAGVARHLLDASPAEAGEALGHVRESAQVVLTELSAILGLLRTNEDPAATAPTPGLGQVDALVDSMRRTGLDVTWSVTGTPATLTAGADLAAYRLVQESLTNARKHGVGRADLTIRHTAQGVSIDVVNTCADEAPVTPGGHGILGMRERITAAGGTLVTGRGADSQFCVHAELPRIPARSTALEGSGT